MERLPGKIKAGNYVSECDNSGVYGVFVFCFVRFVCVFLQKHKRIGVAADFGHCCFF